MVLGDLLQHSEHIVMTQLTSDYLIFLFSSYISLWTGKSPSEAEPYVIVKDSTAIYSTFWRYAELLQMISACHSCHIGTMDAIKYKLTWYMPPHCVSWDLKARIPILRYEQGFSVKDICRVLGIKKSLVYKTLQFYHAHGTTYNPYAHKQGHKCQLTSIDVSLI